MPSRQTQRKGNERRAMKHEGGRAGNTDAAAICIDKHLQIIFVK